MAKKGYILIARAIVDSGIWDKPPYYIKAWIYILNKVAFKPYNNLDVGECFISTSELQNSCTYKVGRRIEQPSKKQIRDFIDFLRSPEGNYEGNNEGHPKGAMIVTTKVTGGMLIKVLNYAKYQNTKYYESNNESNNESQPKDGLKSYEGHPKVHTKIEALESLKHLEALEDPFELINMADLPFEMSTKEFDKQSQEIDAEKVLDTIDEELHPLSHINLFESFEDGFARPISPSEMMRLSEWQEQYGKELVYCALREMVIYQKKSFDYIDKILSSWQQKGYTVDEYLDGIPPSEETRND